MRDRHRVDRTKTKMAEIHKDMETKRRQKVILIFYSLARQEMEKVPQEILSWVLMNLKFVILQNL